jgi:hypothetical protein
MLSGWRPDNVLAGQMLSNRHTGDRRQACRSYGRLPVNMPRAGASEKVASAPLPRNAGWVHKCPPTPNREPWPQAATSGESRGRTSVVEGREHGSSSCEWRVTRDTLRRPRAHPCRRAIIMFCVGGTYRTRTRPVTDSQYVPLLSPESTSTFHETHSSPVTVATGTCSTTWTEAIRSDGPSNSTTSASYPGRRGREARMRSMELE